tara:strand:- start:7801 stop:8037 length:237 start_codon:yes stop_codon:yes gene_type:complete
MTTLLQKIDRFSGEVIWQEDREAAVDLGVVIDCLHQDMEDPADDAAAASFLMLTICDDRPLLEPWIDAIIAEIKKAAA